MASGNSHPALPSTSTNYEMDPAFSPYKRPSNLSSKTSSRRSRFVYSKRSKKAKCHICGITVKKTATLRNHIKFTHGDFVFQCGQCEKLFSRPSNVQKHIQLYHPEIPVVLAKDNYRTLAKSEVPPQVLASMKKKSTLGLMRHIHIPPGTRPPILPTISAFNCYDCTDSFLSLNELFQHCEIHRFSENGKELPRLVPVIIKKR